MALLADDELQVGELTKRLLERLGYEVRWVLDGEQGVTVARESEPYIVITDAFMPVMNGYDFAKALRDGIYSGPIGLYSGKLQDIQAMHPDMGQYVDELLEKPFVPSSFREFVGRLESRRTQGKE